MSDEYKIDDGAEKYNKDLATGEKAEKNTQVRKRIDDLL
jgi:hypothetical protein